MCLAVPGKVVSVMPNETPFASAILEFDGVRREVNVACVPEVQPGDYLMVHAGVAISRVDAAEAARVLAVLRDLGLQEEDAAEVELLPPLETNGDEVRR